MKWSDTVSFTTKAASCVKISTITALVALAHLFSSHHADPSIGPHEEEAGVERPSAHTVISRSVAASDNDGDFRNRRGTNSGNEFRSVLFFC